ncbi:MAG: response regulator transcription factor [Chloroflexota bacterium]|jgi:DNA-binding NarL/FixJ family response regulator
MRIILADNHQHALWALKTTLQEEPDLEIVGEAVDSEGLLRLAEKAAVDLVLVDRKLPGDPIEDLISRLQTLEPKPIIIVMSSNIEDSRKMLKAGADAFVSKGDQPDWLLETLRQYAKRTKNPSRPK